MKSATIPPPPPSPAAAMHHKGHNFTGVRTCLVVAAKHRLEKPLPTPFSPTQTTTPLTPCREDPRRTTQAAFRRTGSPEPSPRAASDSSPLKLSAKRRKEKQRVEEKKP
ncbi:hypothetical protein L484_000178 [Morus notabilis]|uniref:Uncharacterized protein n=1 Tax=Morus notabilis TaxID=981085 RepID=W9T2I5_9ROSA|nr:hypothetical protein L484_000178 [Morus notabilis]